MWDHLQFKYEALNRITPKQITLNWIMKSQTTAGIAQSPCEISVLLRYYEVLSGNSLWMFQDNLLVPSSRVKKSNRTEHE
jgi:hypothetical protein